MPRITYDYIKNLKPSEIGKMKKSEIIKILKSARQKYNTRKGQLYGTWSPALDKMEVYYNENGQTPASRISRNKAINELFNLQSFLSAETSTERGARRVMLEQDIRIFGQTSRGLPKHRMTIEQRSKFWEIYNRFIETNQLATTMYTSAKIIQFLGEIQTGAGSSQLDWSIDDFNDWIEELDRRQREEEEDNGFTTANVFSGRWTPKQR